MQHWLQTGERDLSRERIETERCIITPFSFDTGVAMEELTQEFCKANKDLFVSPFLPTLPEEIEFVTKVVNAIMNGETFENFILEKETRALIGCIGLNNPEENRMNIGLWIRESEHGKGYATETYRALLSWARDNTRYQYLKHSLDPRNDASRKLALKFSGILQPETNEKWDEVYHVPIPRN